MAFKPYRVENCSDWLPMGEAQLMSFQSGSEAGSPAGIKINVRIRLAQNKRVIFIKNP
jgi:hypothetical protein